MKGYWHLPALATVMSILTVKLHSYIFIIVFLSWLCYLFYQGRLKKVPILLSLTVYMILLYYLPQTSLPQETSPLLTKHSISGEIVSPPIITEKYTNFILKEHNSKEKIIVYHFFNESVVHLNDLSHIKFGASCHLGGTVEIPEQSRNPGQFDYQKYLLSQGISYQLILESIDELQCEGSKLLNVVYSLRNNLIHYVSNLLSEQTSSWLNALVLGDDSMLDDQTIDLFQRWSLSHILAISGLHVGLITVLVYFLLIKLNLVTRETAQWIVIVFLPIYAFIAGGAPSVWRASLMGLVFLLLGKLQIKYSVTDVLSIIFIGLIIVDKHIVNNIGFQFSFLVTFGLILSRKWLFQIESSFWQVLKISFVAQMMIVPLQIIYFSTFQPLSILLNSIVVPYFSLFVIPAMFLLLLCSPIFPIFATLFDHIFGYVQSIMIQLLNLIDHYFYFPWIIGDLPLIAIIIYYCLFFFVMKCLEKSELKRAFQFSLCIVLLFYLVVLRPYFSPIGTVTMLDVGQGDAYVIELPYRKGVFLVDAGATFSFTDFNPSPKNFDQIIKPYLYSRGIGKIDAIFISHEDLDHNGSVPLIIEHMKVKKVVISEFYKFNEREKEVILKNNVHVRRVLHEEAISIGGHDFDILAPQYDHNDANENSLVIKTNIGGKSWLFTGDIGKSVEKQLIQTNEQLPIDVLKVAHHGSNTSTDPHFITHINPNYALISAGIHNRYGHPTKEVISTLESNGVLILRTDQHGAVQYRFQKDKGTFLKYLP